MADLSLGPLRIANPDDTTLDTPPQQPESFPPMPAVSPLSQEEAARSDYLSVNPSQSSSAAVSPLQEPTTRAHASVSEPTQPPRQQLTYSPRRPTGEQSQRQSMAYTYQDQQQSQFPQYPTMMPQNLHDPRNNAGRPGSQYYTHLPVTASSNGLTRHSSARSRGDGYSIPARNTSRRPTPVQPGVPSIEAAHTDRMYNRPHAYSQGSAGLGPGPLSRQTAQQLPPSQSRGFAPAPGSATGSAPITENGPPPSSEEWKDRGAAVSIQHSYDTSGRPITKSVKKGVKDFNFGQTLGEGSYSTVLAATDRHTHKEYAIKVLDKRHIIKEKKIKYVNIEKEALNRLSDHPGIVRLYYTFQDERSLYYVLDLCNGGELLGVLKGIGTFDEECTRFYAAQILDTIAHMHARGVIHRDLKPENVLMDEARHIKITDFGTAKMLDAIKDADGRTMYEPDSSVGRNRASSFVGTAEYVSPELLTDHHACKASDLWAFGCIIYQLLAGRPPFKEKTEWLTFQKIVGLEYGFPPGFPDDARDLVERLLVLDPALRLPLEHVKTHPFFGGIRWGKELWSQTAPRLKPYVAPPTSPIRLNGTTAPADPIEIAPPSHSTHATILPPNNGTKATPRLVTELPPPSQLDIEWSPVLTRRNERILKLGNLSVSSSPLPHSPGHDSGNKLSRLFGGGTTKKRQRLVMVTSSARIIVAAAGGEEKKSKQEIGLLSPGTEISRTVDGKGAVQWTVNTHDKHFVFEELKPTKSPDAATATPAATQEWLDVVEQAKDIARSQAAMTNAAPFAGDDPITLPESALSSHASSMSQNPEMGPNVGSSQGSRGILTKTSARDNESPLGRKRFSKRQSKSGLTAVF